MRLTTALLTTAAALTGTSALAADLPMAKAAPVEYVRVCSVHGAGFWYIPGTDTCIKLGGRLRADFIYANPAGFYSTYTTASTAPGINYGTFNRGRNVDATGYEVNGRLNVDVRTSTEWGTLRAFFRYDFYVDSGPFAAGSSSLYATGYAVGLTPGFNTKAFSDAPGAANSGLDLAYVQWAGITAGRAQSFFDFYANVWNFTKISGSDTKLQLFAYTATFGGGFSATLSVEDPTSRVRAPSSAAPTFYTSVYNGTNYITPWYGSGVGVGLGGTRMPDIVGALRYDASWGSAQLSGAVHQTTFSEFTGSTTVGSFPCGSTFGCFEPQDSQYGWAVQGGVKINLPMLAKGDQLWLQAAYANGAISYLQPRFTTFGEAQGSLPDYWVFPNTVYTAGAGAGTYTYTGLSTEATKGWNVLAVMLHYWTPTIRQAVFGSYQKIDNPQGTSVLANPPAGVTAPFYAQYGAPDVTTWQLGTNLVWSPVAGLDIGPEIMYVHIDAGNRPIYNVVTTAGAVAPVVTNRTWATSGSENRWIGRFRIERNF
jgi:hypothetical protein